MHNVTTTITTSILLAALGAIGLSSACTPAGPGSCVTECEENREGIARFAQLDSADPIDEEELCTRSAIVNADDACACKVALKEEFGVSFDDLTCSCPEEEDVLLLHRDNCSLEAVPATDESCLSKERPAYRLREARCRHSS